MEYEAFDTSRDKALVKWQRLTVFSLAIITAVSGEEYFLLAQLPQLDPVHYFLGIFQVHHLQDCHLT